MAKPVTAAAPLCRSCAKQLLKAPSIRRTFATTARQQKNGAVPTFTPTSSVELDSILSSYRSKVFLPAHLNTAHRDLIYKTKNSSAITTEPMIITVAHEDFQLEPLNKLNEPSSRKALKKILPLMKDPMDWRNLSSLLAGLKTASRYPKKGQLVQMARKANEAGMQNIILNCARQVTKTGFRLKDRELVWEVIFGAHLKGQQSGWDEEGTKKALTEAEQVLYLLEEEKHCGGSVFSDRDPRIQPEIVGLALELAAARATKHANGEDADDKVENYAAKLMTLWRNPLLQLSKDKYIANRNLTMWAPVWNGMRMSINILDKKLSGAQGKHQKVTPGLGKLEDWLKLMIQRASKEVEPLLLESRKVVLETAAGKPRRGLEIYDALLK
ncbi:MAG: hypothetical protein M1834_004996 [Cirrosporium novae-zelandiae]|nr:MAG: hypothetical protein M1834_004996 [Cirrosporium novae-zelandiae]